MRRALSYFVAAALPVAICAGLAAARSGRSAVDGSPSDVIFPAQDIPLRFTHARHLARGTECTDCHTQARKSTTSTDRLIPGEEECRGCHAIERDKPFKEVKPGKAPARCDACHVGFDARAPVDATRRVNVPTPNLKFDHSAHAGTECTVCHGDLKAEQTELATRDNLPRMKLCFGCHDGRKAANACTTCHLAGPGGMVRSEYPEGKLMPSGVLRGDAHDSMFRTNHGAVARNDERYCGNCHKKAFCTECHDGVVKPMDFHPAEYVSLHALDARRNTPDCSTCHREQTFCVGCHARSGVAGDTIVGRDVDFEVRGSDYVSRIVDQNRTAEQRFHPSGWVRYNNLGRLDLGADGNPSRAITHHSYQAQRNIRTCVACHRESFCTQCHTPKVNIDDASPAINPHPNGWRSSRQCRALAARAGRMCLRCHVNTTDFTGCDWSPRF
ncbi:MAG TPA: cytochrome c3 family protein [Kofleriaceae bacterium]|nr:cytochrome c3 family protein [Kofleriaceae bacterium]